MEKSINFNSLKPGDIIQVVNKNNAFGWPRIMEESLGKFFLIRAIFLPTSSYGGGISLSNGYIYPFECFNGKFKKKKESKWKSIWKNI